MAGKTLLFLLLFICALNVKSENAVDKIAETLQNLRLPALLHDLKDNVDQCGPDLGDFLNSTIQAKRWALQMLDSSAKIPTGILKGNIKNLGQYDECLEVEHPTKEFVGQYCLLSLNLELDIPIKKNSSYNVSVSLPGAMQYGLCLPSSCSSTEIENGLNKVLGIVPILKNIISVTIGEENCSTKEAKALKSGDWAVIGVLVLFGSVALLSTAYDVYQQLQLKIDKPHPLLTSFSIYSNGKNLLQVTESEGQLKALHGIRFLSMCWVVLLHAYMIVWLNGPVVNLFDLGKAIKDPHHTVIINGIISVDTFFFLSGFLVCIVFFRDIGRKGYYDVPLAYIHRYIRVTPSYGMMILIFSTIYIYMGDGPLWHSINSKSVESCKSSWWSGILYVQSFVDPNSNCVPHSWYLSTDMHFYWLSPLILYPLYFWPSYSYYFLGFVILISVCVNFAVAYVKEIGASLLTVVDTKYQMEVDYTKFYMRAAPYLIGLATGYLTCRIQSAKMKVKLNKIRVIVGWTVSTGLCLGSLYGIVPFTDFIKNKYPSLDASLYLALGRLGWGIGLAWIVFACLHGYGGPVNTLLSWNAFQPLAKLSYNVYLLHGIVQLYRIGNLRININTGDLDITYGFLGDLMLSYLLAIPFTLLFEMPFGNIDRYLFRQVKILPLSMSKKEKNKNIA